MIQKKYPRKKRKGNYEEKLQKSTEELHKSFRQPHKKPQKIVKKSNENKT